MTAAVTTGRSVGGSVSQGTAGVNGRMREGEGSGTEWAVEEREGLSFKMGNFLKSKVISFGKLYNPKKHS